MLFASIIAISCASSKLEETPPFQVISAKYYFHNTSKSIHIKYETTENIKFDSISFHGHKAKAITQKREGSTYVLAEFNNILKSDLVLDNNPVKEFNNAVPNVNKLPFNLKNDEAILSYKINNKIRYYKISGVLRGENPLEDKN